MAAPTTMWIPFASASTRAWGRVVARAPHIGLVLGPMLVVVVVVVVVVVAVVWDVC